MVSIIIPCYNAQEYISNAIESALGQSFKSIEVIVVDDGSKDNSAAIIKKYLPYIIFLPTENKGGCAARNIGAKIAKGKYLQFLDADDVLLPDCIEKKLNAHNMLDEEEKKRVIICSKICALGDSDPNKMSSNWFKGDFCIEKLILEGGPPTSSPLHDSEVFWRVGGFREGLQCAQEYDLHLRLALYAGQQFKMINHTGVLIRAPENSVSRSKSAKWERAFYTSLSSILQNGCLDKADDLVRAAYAKKLAKVGRAFYRQKDNITASKIFHYARMLSHDWNQGLYKHPSIDYLALLIGPKIMEDLHENIKHILLSVR